MRRIKEFVPATCVFAGAVFSTCLLVFSILRLLFMLTNHALTGNIPSHALNYALFNRGLLYDINVSSYLIILPFIVLCFGEIFTRLKQVLDSIAKYLLFSMICLILAIYASDFPFFSYYNSHLTKAIFSWIDHPLLMVKALFSYGSYMVFFVLFIIGCIVILKWIRFLHSRIIVNKYVLASGRSFQLIGLLACLFLILIGMRGEFRLHYKPLLPEHALFSNYAFANQLGMNPVFSFVESYSSNNINYFDDKVAVSKACKYLKIKPEYNSPVARKVSFDNPVVKHNVVIILMESMSADIMGIYGHPDKLTPFLDSLAIENIAFSAIYTDGIHTYNGVFSSLYGLPSVLNFKPTKTPLTVANKYSGISDILHPLGYRTLYFCNGDKDFDNLDFFLRSNEFDEVIGQEEYASEVIYNNWGVTDHTMFENSLNRLNTIHRNNQPFLAAFMTISAHVGYVPPKEATYSFRSKESQKQAYEFADLSLRYFFNEASKQDWYDNTIFLLIADHGQNLKQTYDLSLSYFHTPLIIVAPFLHERKQYDKIGLQLDVVPTIMGILKIPYINNTLGIDLRQESRPFAYFSSDDKIGCLNERYFLVIRNHGKESLYQYKNNDLNNYLDQHQQLADSMRAYVYSMYQTTQYLINSKKTALPQ